MMTIAFGKSVYFRLPGSTLKIGRFQKSNQALNERGESGASAKGADEIGDEGEGNGKLGFAFEACNFRCFCPFLRDSKLVGPISR